jgi:hypothetical protein
MGFFGTTSQSGVNYLLLLTVAVTAMGWVHKATLAPLPFLIYYASQSKLLSVHETDISSEKIQGH